MRWFAFSFLLFSSHASGAPLTKVPIHFLEALAPRDTTSSERFQKEYETAITTARILTAKRLANCGYELEARTTFYAASDALQAREGAQAAERAKAWLIVGPRRSNHYILLAQGAPGTPSISTMASSREVEELGRLHLSISPTNRELAEAAVSSVRERVIKTPSYVSIVSSDCLGCVDFSDRFDVAAKKAGLPKIAEYRISGETPVLTEIVAAVEKTKPPVVLVPNLSKVTAQVIASIQKAHPAVFFVGGDGWGDSRFGFVQNATDLDGTQGITVRGFPSADEGLKAFALGRELSKSSDVSLQKPGSAVALAVLKIIEGTTQLLCEEKPQSSAAFKSAFTGKRERFKSPWGVSIYRLKDGDISFDRIAKKAAAR